MAPTLRNSGRPKNTVANFADHILRRVTQGGVKKTGTTKKHSGSSSNPRKLSGSSLIKLADTAVTMALDVGVRMVQDGLGMLHSASNKMALGMSLFGTSAVSIALKVQFNSDRGRVPVVTVGGLSVISSPSPHARETGLTDGKKADSSRDGRRIFRESRNFEPTDQGHDIDRQNNYHNELALPRPVFKIPSTPPAHCHTPNQNIPSRRERGIIDTPRPPYKPLQREWSNVSLQDEPVGRMNKPVGRMNKAAASVTREPVARVKSEPARVKSEPTVKKSGVGSVREQLWPLVKQEGRRY